MSFQRDTSSAGGSNLAQRQSSMRMESSLFQPQDSVWNSSPASPMITHNNAAAAAAAAAAAGSDGKRQRVSRACDRCRRKKVKCDGARPVCSHCQVLGCSCTYLDATKKRGPPKGYIEAIENRLHTMEGLLSGLANSDSNAARYILAAMRDAEDGNALVADSNGRLFGDTTVADLETRAAQTQDSAEGVQSDAITNDPSTHPHPTGSDIPNAATDSSSTAKDPAANARKDGRPSEAARGPKDCTVDECTDVDCSEHLTHLEKGVGHLTLDPTGALRYLGDSSGWYIINRSLVSSESSPRLTKGVDGAFRWPPITSIPTRESESAEHASSHGASNAVSSAGDDAGSKANPGASSVTNASHSAGSGSGAGPSADGAVSSGAAGGSIGCQASKEKPCVVAVPRNMPPCGKPPMPDADEAYRLIQLYFRYVHPVFPILYKSYFLEKFFCKENRPSPALMSAVYAAASTYKAREAKCERDLARVRIQMAVHFQRAKLYLDEQYTLNTTASILTLLLMSVYEQGTMSTRSWLYSGMAIRKAYDLGLHRDVGISKHNGPSVLSRTESEVRLRAWWGCYIMDIMVSATLGRPTTIHDFTFDAPFPTNYGEDGDELLVESSLSDSPATDVTTYTPGTLYATNGPQSTSHASQQQQPPPPPPHHEKRQQEAMHDHAAAAQEPTANVAVVERLRDYVSLSVGESESDGSDIEGDEEFGERRPQEGKPLGAYYLELLHILGHILTEMYACKPHRSYIAKYCLHDLHSRTERLITLDHELRQWKMSLPSVLQYPVDDILGARPARCVYIALIHLVYYTAMILLHRPFISRLGDQHSSASHGGTTPLDDRAMHSDAKRTPEAGLSQEDGPDSPASGGSSSRSNTTSPLPSHGICTLSAQMISLIGQAIIQDSRIFIMPFLTFMMFTAGTLHLNNVIVAADSWIARRFLKRTLNVMSRLGAHWQVSYKCYTMLNTLVRANRIGLDQVIEDSEAGIRVIKDRCREISRVAHSVYENRSLYRDRHSSARLSTMRSASPRVQLSANKNDDEADANKTSSLDDSSSSHSRLAAGGPRRHERSAQPAPPQQRPQREPQGPHTPATASMDIDEGPVCSPTNIELAAKGMSGRRYSSATRSQPVDERVAHFDAPRLRRKTFLNADVLSRAESGSGHTPATSDSGSRPVSVAAKMLPGRHGFDKEGVPIVPASPYTSVNLGGNRSSSADLFQSLSPEHSSTGASSSAASSAFSSQAGVPLASEPARMNPPAAVSTLGQFVPSLEFFANADFPLGIGGPNGQASTVIPTAMATTRPNSGPYTLLSFSDQLGPSPGLGAPATTASFAGTISSSDIAAPTTIAAAISQPSIDSYGNNGNSGSGIAKSFASATALMASPMNAAPMSAAPSLGVGGFGYNNPNNVMSPAAMGLDGKFISDDLLRNMPFSGPVSCDLSLNGMNDFSSILWPGGNRGSGSAAAAGCVDASPNGGSRESGSISAPSGTQGGSSVAAAAASSVTTAPEDGSFSEMPWKDYVSQVIRMFYADHATDESNIGSEAVGDNDAGCTL